MRCRIRGEAGTVTAEFAAVLPAIVLILACALGALQLSSEQLRLQGATSEAARLAGRGDPGAAAEVRSVAPDASISVHRSGILVCVDSTAAASFGILTGLTLTASSCALDDATP